VPLPYRRRFRRLSQYRCVSASFVLRDDDSCECYLRGYCENCSDYCSVENLAQTFWTVWVMTWNGEIRFGDRLSLYQEMVVLRVSI